MSGCGQFKGDSVERLVVEGVLRAFGVFGGGGG